MQLNRFPTTPSYENPFGMEEMQEPLTVKCGVMMGLSQEIVTNNRINNTN